jgi:hypothetical protein
MYALPQLKLDSGRIARAMKNFAALLPAERKDQGIGRERRRDSLPQLKRDRIHEFIGSPTLFLRPDLQIASAHVRPRQPQRLADSEPMLIDDCDKKPIAVGFLPVGRRRLDQRLYLLHCQMFHRFSPSRMMFL